MLMLLILVILQEIKDLQKKLYCQCSDFIRSNLHRVVATGGWNTLDNETRSSFASGMSFAVGTSLNK